jgi:hypothetical protein
MLSSVYVAEEDEREYRNNMEFAIVFAAFIILLITLIRVHQDEPKKDETADQAENIIDYNQIRSDPGWTTYANKGRITVRL